jgi:hypothetical protein
MLTPYAAAASPIGSWSGMGPDRRVQAPACRQGKLRDLAADIAAANEVLLEGGYGERFVSVKLAFLQAEPAQRLVRVRLGGSGHPV